MDDLNSKEKETIETAKKFKSVKEFKEIEDIKLKEIKFVKYIKTVRKAEGKLPSPKIEEKRIINTDEGRLRKALKNSGIRSIGDLTNYTAEELQMLPQIGEFNYRIIKCLLDDLGIDLYGKEKKKKIIENICKTNIRNR